MKNIKIKSILMPTDFSELSEKALKTAITISKRHNARLTLLNVVDAYLLFSSPEVLSPYFYTVSNELKANSEENLKKIASKAGKLNNIEIDTKVMDGNPADIICKLAEEGKYDMIVMGTHGASGFREFFIGSNAFSVVKYSPCPVLTIPGNWKKTEFKKAVFPIRLIPGSIDKYEYARPIIKKNNSELLVVGLIDNEEPDTLAEFKTQADNLSFKLKEDNIKYSTIVLQSTNFPHKLLNAAEGYDADLIVISASLDFEWKNLFIGPYAQQIVNHSKCPVLSIKLKSEIKELYIYSEEQMKLASDKYLNSIVFD